MRVTILKSSDGGETWFSETNGAVNGWWYGLSFCDANTGTIVGMSGKIIRTTNGGMDWFAQSSGTSKDLYDVCFYDSSNGIAVGYYSIVLRTTDGGASWIQSSYSGYDYLHEIIYLDQNDVRVIGWNQYDDVGVYLKSTNSGLSWTKRTIGAVETRGFSFSDVNTGTAVGPDGKIIRTTNGGTSWFSQSEGSRNDLYGISFPDDTVLEPLLVLEYNIENYKWWANLHF